MAEKILTDEEYNRPFPEYYVTVRTGEYHRDPSTGHFKLYGKKVQSLEDYLADKRELNGLFSSLCASTHSTSCTVGAKNDENKPPVSQMFKQFPHAMTAITKCSQHGHEKYAENGWRNWERVPDGFNRYSDAMCRHLLKEETEPIDESGLPTIFHTTWNAVARLELWLRDHPKYLS